MHSRVRRTARGGDERFASRADENGSDAFALARPDPEPELDPEEAGDAVVADPAEGRDPSRDLASEPLAKSSTRSVEGVEGVFEGRRGAAAAHHRHRHHQCTDPCASATLLPANNVIPFAFAAHTYTYMHTYMHT